MKLHIYTNNAYDTVALIDDDKVLSQWDASAIKEVLESSDPSDWDNQGLELDLEEFEEGQELWAIVTADGVEKPDAALYDKRYDFYFRD